jgi:hypothetical protein
MSSPFDAKHPALNQALSSADLPAIFAILKTWSNIYHKDTPLLSETARQTIRTSPEKIRQLALGLIDPSRPIRRFSKEYLSQLGAVAAPDLFCLLLESLDPLRRVKPDEGLLGAYGGYASPLGEIIHREKLSLSPANPQESGCEASRFADQVLEPFAELLALTDFRYFLAACEYCLGVLSPEGPTAQSPFGDTHSGVIETLVQYHLSQSFRRILHKRARENDADVFCATQIWTRQQSLFEQPEWQDEIFQIVKVRFQALAERPVAAFNLYRIGLGYFSLFPAPQRMALYRQILQQALTPEQKRMCEDALQAYLNNYYTEALHIQSELEISQL